MSDEFFKKIDATLAEQAVKIESKDALAQVNQAFVTKLIPKLAETANEYAAKCAERRISAKVESSTSSISFILTPKSGSTWSLVLTMDQDRDNQVTFHTFLPDENGRPYRTSSCCRSYQLRAAPHATPIEAGHRPPSATPLSAGRMPLLRRFVLVAEPALIPSVLGDQ
jgi:hypothetical protein